MIVLLEGASAAPVNYDGEHENQRGHGRHHGQSYADCIQNHDLDHSKLAGQPGALVVSNCGQVALVKGFV
jgi:hypothetical protein